MSSMIRSVTAVLLLFILVSNSILSKNCRFYLDRKGFLENNKLDQINGSKMGLILVLLSFTVGFLKIIKIPADSNTK